MSGVKNSWMEREDRSNVLVIAVFFTKKSRNKASVRATAASSPTIKVTCLKNICCHIRQREIFFSSHPMAAFSYRFLEMSKTNLQYYSLGLYLETG